MVSEDETQEIEAAISNIENTKRELSYSFAEIRTALESRVAELRAEIRTFETKIADDLESLKTVQSQ